MTAIIIIAAVLLLLCCLYIFSVMGRRKHPELATIRQHVYAHRGLHDSARPENSMAAFRAAKDAGYGIELDVHLLSDGTLAIMHDSALKRTTGAEGRIEDLTAEQLSQYKLEGTDETIPLFEQVLQLYQGELPMIVELKVVDNNYAPLCEAVCKMLDRYPGTYALECFDPRCVRWLKQTYPERLRGQLNQNYSNGEVPFPWILRFLMTHQCFNFLTMPDFVAYRFCDRRNLGNFLVRKLWRVQGATWTLTTREEFDRAIAEGWLPIFENFTPQKEVSC